VLEKERKRERKGSRRMREKEKEGEKEKKQKLLSLPPTEILRTNEKRSRSKKNLCSRKSKKRA
jgi:hypothetical protein